MNINTLATKYRPDNFESVCGQLAITKILTRQIETNTFKNCYMFCGSSGCGKTTIARIMAKAINKGIGEPIELDAASNNGVDNVRDIIENANKRAIDGEYKIYILDECHMLTTAAWNALLKLIEEPPKYTIFIFCTTELQKVPATIVNRCQVYLFGKIPYEQIVNRLNYICNCEHYNATKEGIDQIAKMANGSMRQAISYLDKCKDYSIDITVENVCLCLGDLSYDVYFKLTDAIVDNNPTVIMSIIDKLSVDGVDLKTFITNYVSFILQLSKYTIFGSMQNVDIPVYLEEKVKYSTGIENRTEYFNKLVDRVLEIKQAIKGDSDLKTTIEIMLLACAR